jgi:hypothetical protein
MAMPELTSEERGHLAEVDETALALRRAYHTLALAKTISDTKAAIDPAADPIRMRYAIEAWQRLPELDPRDVEPALEQFLRLVATPAGLRAWGAVQYACRRNLNGRQVAAAHDALRVELARWRCDQRRRTALTADDLVGCFEQEGFLDERCLQQREGDHVGD